MAQVEAVRERVDLDVMGAAALGTDPEGAAQPLPRLEGLDRDGLLDPSPAPLFDLLGIGGAPALRTGRLRETCCAQILRCPSTFANGPRRRSILRDGRLAASPDQRDPRRHERVDPDEADSAWPFQLALRHVRYGEHMRYER
jgi:hypothetical protein